MEKQTNTTDKIIYSISILIRQSGYSFLVVNENQKCVEEHKEVHVKNENPDGLVQKIQEDYQRIWKINYKESRLHIIYQHSYFTIVPNEVYESKHNGDYLKYNTVLFPSDIISCDCNAYFDVSIPFIPFVNIHNELLEYYSSLGFYHAVNSALNSSYQLCKNQSGEYAFVYIQQNSFFLVLIKDGNLKMANYFNFDTAEDFAYYCLFAIEQFKFDKQHMHFSFVGKISKESEIFTLVYNYIRHVVVINVLELNLNLKNKVSHESEIFLNQNPILALQLCESFQEN